MALFSFSDKKYQKGQKTTGFLFISYLMTEQRIINVWRVDSTEQTYTTLKEFVISQVDRIDITNFIPEVRIYQFNFQDMRRVPLISSDNSHFIQFVSQKEPEVNISILEAMFLIREEIEPISPITESSPHFEAFQKFLDHQEQIEDRLLWEQQITKDAQSTNYDLLANIILKYGQQPDITEQQIELLNKQDTALRIFHTLRDYFEQTDFIQNGWDLDNFDYLIHIPVSGRTPLHIIRAELFKVIDFKNEAFQNHPDKEKMQFELNLFLSGLNVTAGWENNPIPDDWKTIACSSMTNAITATEAIGFFQYLPAITEEQINYLIRTGTVAATFVHSGIMGNVFTKTPLFKLRYGLFLEHFKAPDPSPMDHLIIDSLELMATEVFDQLQSNNSESPELATVRETIRAVNTYRQSTHHKKLQETRQRNLNQLNQILTQIAEAAKEADLPDAIPYDEEYLEDLVRENFADTELSASQCSLFLNFLPHIPAEVIKKVIPFFKGQEYGKRPEHLDLSLSGVIKAIKTHGISPLHQLVLHVEKRRLDESITATDKEISELHRQITRANERITTCENDLENKKIKRLELRTLMSLNNIATSSNQTVNPKQ